MIVFSLVLTYAIYEASFEVEFHCITQLTNVKEFSKNFISVFKYRDNLNDEIYRSNAMFGNMVSLQIAETENQLINSGSCRLIPTAAVIVARF